MAYLIYQVVSDILQIYRYVLIARFILSWVPDLERTALGLWIYRLTEPYFGPFRRVIPSVRMGNVYLDLSMLVGFIAYWFVEIGVMSVLSMLLGMVG